jgi:hypothetical protein
MQCYPRYQVDINNLITKKKVKLVPVLKHYSMKTHGPVNALFPAFWNMLLHVAKFSAPAALPLMKCFSCKRTGETQRWSERSGGTETNC